MDTFLKRNMRNRIYSKTDGLCAYSGSELIAGWVYVKIDRDKECEVEYGDYDNLLAIQKEIGEYKGDLTVEEFRRKLLRLHIDISKLPEFSDFDEDVEHEEFLLKIASYFGITKEKPFSGVFYYDTLIKSVYEATSKANEYLISVLENTDKELSRVEELRLAEKMARKDKACSWVVVNLRERIGFELSLINNNNESI